MMNGFGSNADQLAALQSLTPEQRKTLIGAEWLPEQFAQQQRSSHDEQARLQNQLDAAQGMMTAPIEAPRSTSAGVVVPTVLGNVLRTFGGAFLANKKAKELADQQAQSGQQFQDLIKQGQDSTGLVKMLEQKRLEAQALRQGGQQTDPYAPDAYGRYGI